MVFDFFFFFLVFNFRGFMKKIILFCIFLIMIIISGFFLIKYFKKNNLDANKINISKEKELYIRPILEYKQNTQSLDIKKEIYKESLHEGSAIFAGPYRLELSVFNYENKTAIYGLFIDNSLAMPTLPKGTEIELLINNKPLKLIAIKNGLLANQGDLCKLPCSIKVGGTINNKKINTTLKVIKYRKEIINHRVEK